jgi:hypothetical protein
MCAAQTPPGNTVIPAAYQLCSISGSAATTCLVTANTGVGRNPQFFVGVFNGASSAQTQTISCTDGTNTYAIAALGASQQILFPAPGLPLVGSPKIGAFVCTPSGALTGTVYVEIR